MPLLFLSLPPICLFFSFYSCLACTHTRACVVVPRLHFSAAGKGTASLVFLCATPQLS